MIRILLACAAGMSSSMLVHRMNEAIQKHPDVIVIDAVSNSEVNDLIGEFDVLLLGPQLSYLLETYTKEMKAFGVPTGQINIKDYGRMDGDRVLQQALDLYYAFQKEEH